MSSSSSSVSRGSPLDSDSLTFLNNYAKTQRFRLGTPTSFAASSRGDYVYFLRPEASGERAQNLFELSVSTRNETLLVRAVDLVKQESMTEEERKLRERKRLTSTGILSFQLCPVSPHLILIPYQQHLYLFDKRSKHVTNLTEKSTFESHGPPSYAQFSPNGKKIAFVRNGDIFVVELLELDGAADIPHSEFRLTFTGTNVDPQSVNGIAEFIAQEELGRFRGFWWSPDSEHMLYQHTDNSQVEQFSILDLCNPQEAATRNAYPRPGKANAKVTMGIIKVERCSSDAKVASDVEMKSPEDSADAAANGTPGSAAAKKRKRTSSGAGAASSSSSSTAAGEDDIPSTPVSDPLPSTTWLSWEKAGQNSFDEFPYLCTVAWESCAPLTIIMQNRLQTVSQVLLVDDIATGEVRELFRETDDRWVNIDHSVPHWLSDGQHFLWSSERTGFASLELFDRSGKRVRALTENTSSVGYRKLLHVDETHDVCYILGGSDATQQHVCRIPLGLKPSSSHPTVSLTSSAAIHSAVFANDGRIYVHERHNLTDGSKFVVRKVPSIDAKTSKTEDENQTAGELLAEIHSLAPAIPSNHLPRIELKVLRASDALAHEEKRRSDAMIAADRATNPLTLALAEAVPKRQVLVSYEDLLEEEKKSDASFVATEREYNVAVLRPQTFDSTKKYPVVCYVYGGPGHRLVTCDRATWLIAQLVADAGFIVVTTDNRGTPFRGADWEKAIKGNLVNYPLADQVTVIKALAGHDNSMDLSKGVGIFGWSFGGYLSALAAMIYPSLFTSAFVGAPVCDWRWYDSCYTERYLGLPLEREADYDTSSVLTYAPNLLRPLLLVHGSSDDNVYFAHALHMSQEMFKHGREHVFLPLTGTHMLADPISTVAMYTRLIGFLKQHSTPAQ